MSAGWPEKCKHHRFLADNNCADCERAACAELVRAAGCVCPDLEAGAGRRLLHKRDYGSDLVLRHDPRCPEALAAAIESRGKQAGEPERAGEE